MNLCFFFQACEEKFKSLPMLETSTFIAALSLALETTNNDEYEEMFQSLSEFIGICLTNFDWTWDILVVQDRCLSLSMLISSTHQLESDSELLLKALAIVLLKKKDSENFVVRMIHKYRLALLEMALRGDKNELFCSALFKFLHENEDEFIIDDWDPKLVETLAKKCLENKDKTALKSMLLISAIAQDVLLEQGQVLVTTTETLEKNSSEKLRLLNNFVYKNAKGQRFLAENLTLQRNLVSFTNKILGQFVIAAQDVKKNLMVVICDIISLITTWTSHCPEAKSVLASNVGMERAKSTCLLQILVGIINNANLGDHVIRSRIWIPNCFRIVIASLTSIECRSWVIRTQKFLNGRCIKDLDQPNPDPSLEVLWLDLLLSLTSYPVSSSYNFKVFFGVIL